MVVVLYSFVPEQEHYDADQPTDVGNSTITCMRFHDWVSLLEYKKKKAQEEARPSGIVGMIPNISLSMIFKLSLRLLYLKGKLPSASNPRHIVSVPKQEK